jgi:Uma2 family endonuclease
MDARQATHASDTAREIERHRFNVDEVIAMQDAGVVAAGDYELLDGDLCVVAAKKNDHEIIKRKLAAWLIRHLPEQLCVAVEASLFLDAHNAPEPDIMIHADALLPEDVRGSDVLLLIEIADQSLTKDLGPKADLYGAHGVGEYWVIDAATRTTHLHKRSADQTGWHSVTAIPAGAALTLLPTGGTITLADL